MFSSDFKGGGDGPSIIFNGAGLDELSCVGPITIIEIQDAKMRQYILDPAEYGLSRCTVAQLQGGSAATNAALLTASLQGQPGPIADTLVLNAGVANYLYGVTDTIGQGIEVARLAHEQGAGFRVLEQLVATTRSLPTLQETNHA